MRSGLLDFIWGEMELDDVGVDEAGVGFSF